MGPRAAPTVQEVTGQKDFGNEASLIPNWSLMTLEALVIEVALNPTMKVLEVEVREHDYN